MVMNNGNTVLTIMMDEYSKEKERMNILENKAIAIITILIAIITVYLPIIPFDKINDFCMVGNVKSRVSITTIILFLLVSMGLAVYTFCTLISVIKLRCYKAVDIELLVKEDTFEFDEKLFQIEMCKHYKNIIIENSKKNIEKAEKIRKCFNMIIVIFILLFLSTIVLSLL